MARSPVDEVEGRSFEVGKVPLVADLHHCLHEEAEIAPSSGRLIFEPIGPCLILPSLDEPVFLQQFQPVRQGEAVILPNLHDAEAWNRFEGSRTELMQALLQTGLPAQR